MLPFEMVSVAKESRLEFVFAGTSRVHAGNWVCGATCFTAYCAGSQPCIVSTWVDCIVVGSLPHEGSRPCDRAPASWRVRRWRLVQGWRETGRITPSPCPQMKASVRRIGCWRSGCWMLMTLTPKGTDSLSGVEARFTVLEVQSRLTAGEGAVRVDS